MDRSIFIRDRGNDLAYLERGTDQEWNAVHIPVRDRDRIAVQNLIRERDRIAVHKILERGHDWG